MPRPEIQTTHDHTPIQFIRYGERERSKFSRQDGVHGPLTRILHGKGTFVTWLESVARVDVLILDDWGVSALDSGLRSDLLEIIDDRCGTRATIMTSQLPVEHWHAWIGDQTIADAILDRLLSRSHRIQLRGESLRPREPLSADQGGSKTEN